MPELADSLLGCTSCEDRSFVLDDYGTALPRWCSGCGDHSVLGGVQRLLETKQLRPERTVFVSGIGCSSRFPHYVNSYGFHGIHGRALPIATGVKLARPDLDVFVVMGDGDCCSIGAGHWIHATRYNTNLVALMLDNNIYGLTKNQTSPTTPQGHTSNTQPRGSYLPALDPISATLGVTNASFVAQTADWAPGHLYETIRAAFEHPGFSFVRILQRCPVFTPMIFQQAVRRPETTELLVHPDGVHDPDAEKIYKNHVTHDPSDLGAAQDLSRRSGTVRLGLYYRNDELARYEAIRHVAHHTREDRIGRLDAEFDRHAV